jgi:hypothetical protein
VVIDWLDCLGLGGWSFWGEVRYILVLEAGFRLSYGHGCVSGGVMGFAFSFFTGYPCLRSFVVLVIYMIFTGCMQDPADLRRLLLWLGLTFVVLAAESAVAVDGYWVRKFTYCTISLCQVGVSNV